MEKEEKNEKEDMTIGDLAILMANSFGVLTNDVNGLKSDMNSVKTDISEIKSDIIQIKSDLSSFKTETRENFKEVKKSIKENKESINIPEKLLESHFAEYTAQGIGKREVILSEYLIEE